MFKLVFQGDVLVAFDSAYRLARQRQLWFRLQFSFDSAPEAVNLPWEGLVAPREGQTLAWVRANKLRDYPMPPADIPLIPHLIDLLM